MQHDPFCKAYYPDLLEVERCAWCMVIRRVREDEQNKVDLDVEHWIGYNNGYTQGYMDGYSDAEGHAKEWSLNEDNKPMSTNGDNDATNNS